MSLMVFLLLSAVLAVAVGILASLLLRSLMKDQRRLEKNTDEAPVTDPCQACTRTGAPVSAQDENPLPTRNDKTQGVEL
jgi:hypothetical protein